MKTTRIAAVCALALLLTPTLPALAGSDSYTRNLAFVGERTVQLVEAIPEENFGWRPMEGVRSVSEAAMHMASANYFFGGRLGTAAPEGIDTENMEKITAKAEVVAALKASLDHMSKAFAAVEDSSAEMDIFGREGTVEGMMLIAIGHVHEHFGQLIAYARSNEVVPPWSQPQEDG